MMNMTYKVSDFDQFTEERKGSSQTDSVGIVSLLGSDQEHV